MTMDAPISMSRAAHEAERLRRIRQYTSDLPPGTDRDELQTRLHAETHALSTRSLVTG